MTFNASSQHSKVYLPSANPCRYFTKGLSERIKDLNNGVGSTSGSEWLGKQVVRISLNVLYRCAQIPEKIYDGVNALRMLVIHDVGLMAIKKVGIPLFKIAYGMGYFNPGNSNFSPFVSISRKHSSILMAGGHNPGDLNCHERTHSVASAFFMRLIKLIDSTKFEDGGKITNSSIHALRSNAKIHDKNPNGIPLEGFNSTGYFTGHIKVLRHQIMNQQWTSATFQKSTMLALSILRIGARFLDCGMFLGALVLYPFVVAGQAVDLDLYMYKTYNAIDKKWEELSSKMFEKSLAFGQIEYDDKRPYNDWEFGNSIIATCGSGFSGGRSVVDVGQALWDVGGVFLGMASDMYKLGSWMFSAGDQDQTSTSHNDVVAASFIKENEEMNKQLKEMNKQLKEMIGVRKTTISLNMVFCNGEYFAQDNDPEEDDDHKGLDRVDFQRKLLNKVIVKDGKVLNEQVSCPREVKYFEIDDSRDSFEDALSCGDSEYAEGSDSFDLTLSRTSMTSLNEQQNDSNSSDGCDGSYAGEDIDDSAEYDRLFKNAGYGYVSVHSNGFSEYVP
ncbi:MAG: hypothetical protein FJZ57_05535 [Chlamydiae bacterium]|nr:hypothetical protein [Chlamydiota bacterium]